MYNTVAGVGSFFLFQILIVFLSVYVAYSVFVSAFWFFGFLIALIATFIFYRWMNFLNKLHHGSIKIGIFIIQFFINLIIAFELSIPFCLSLFDQQILFQIYLKTGKTTIGSIEQLWLKPYGLYESWFTEKEGIVILFICVAIIILIFFILTTPYVLIVKNKKLSYTLIKHYYEQNF